MASAAQSFYNSIVSKGQPTSSTPFISSRGTTTAAAKFYTGVKSGAIKNVSAPQNQKSTKKVAVTDKNKGFFDGLFAGFSLDRLKESLSAGTQQAIGSVKTGLGALRESNRKQSEKGTSIYDKLVIGKDGKLAVDKSNLEKQKIENAKLIKQGNEQQNKAGERLNKMGKAEGKGTQLIEGLTQNAPGFAASTGIATATLLITKNPQLAATLGFSNSYAQTAGQMYNEAKNYGVSDEKAFDAANKGGLAVGVIDQLPLGRILSRTPQGEAIKKKLVTEVVKSFVLQGGEEATTEGVQQVIQNALAKVYYDPSRKLLDGAGESALYGFIMGGGSGALSDISTAVNIPDQKKLNLANEKIDEAINTPRDKRSEEQQNIVNSVLRQDFTPTQIIQYVAKSDIATTSEGHDLIKTALDAQRNGKNLSFIQDEDTGEITVEIADRKTPEQIQQEIETESKKVELRKAVRLKDEYGSDLEKVTTQRVYDDPEKYKNEYVKRFGNEINTDLARELFAQDGYNEANSPQVQNAATAVRDMVFDEIINTKQGQGNNTILITAGGSGSGKSTALEAAFADKENYPGIFDTTLANKSMEKKIDAILEKGFDVRIAFVMRDIVDAWENGVLKHKRTVGENYHIDAHMQARERVLSLMEKFKDDKRVDIQVIDNTNGKENIKVVENPVDFLKSFNYNTADVRKKIQDATERAKQSGKVSEEQYKGFTNDRVGRGSSEQSQEKPTETRQQEKHQVTSKGSQPVSEAKEEIIQPKTLEERERDKYKDIPEKKTMKEYDPDFYKGIAPENIIHFNQGQNARVTLIVPAKDKELIQLGARHAKMMQGKLTSAERQVYRDGVKRIARANDITEGEAAKLIKETYDKYRALAKANATKEDPVLLNTIPKPELEVQAKTEEPKENQQTKENKSENQKPEIHDEPKEQVTSKEPQRIINTKEVQAVKQVIDDRITLIKNEAKDEKDVAKQVELLYSEVSRMGNNDKVVLSALRTKLNQLMFDLAGAGGGNYKEQYRAVQIVMKEDPVLGEVLSKIDDYVKELDKKLLTAQESPRITPDASKPNAANSKSNDDPKGTGLIKESRLFKRVKEVLGAEFDSQRVTYNELSLEKQAQAVTDLIENDPKRAARIAQGLEEVPQGMTQNAVSLGLFSVASGKGDFQTAADLLSSTSLRSTRLGQELVSLRGAFNGDTPENAVKRIIQSRLEKISDQYKSEINNMEIEKDVPKAKKATKLIERQAKDLKKRLTDEQKRRINSAQEVIEMLKCK